MIIDYKFEYGSKEIPFNEELIFVDPVDSVHDLNYWEDTLEDDYAVYSIQNKLGYGKIDPVISYQWVILSNKDISFNQLQTETKEA